MQHPPHHGVYNITRTKKKLRFEGANLTNYWDRPWLHYIHIALWKKKNNEIFIHAFIVNVCKMYSTVKHKSILLPYIACKIYNMMLKL